VVTVGPGAVLLSCIVGLKNSSVATHLANHVGFSRSLKMLCGLTSCFRPCNAKRITSDKAAMPAWFVLWRPVPAVTRVSRSEQNEQAVFVRL
jgi:hypothetical protein